MSIRELLSENYLQNLGVVDWGYTEESVPNTLKHFQSWLKLDRNGPLGYMADHRAEAREDIKNYFPEFQSALVFLFSYARGKKELEQFYQRDDWNGNKIAGYAMGFEGRDYHYDLRERLEQIATKVSKEKTLFSLDTQPILERDLAYRAGLGWFGKNSMLINREHGSYVMLGAILLSEKLDLTARPKEVDHCGTCTACIDACPTNAIDGKKRQIISDKCISTFSIELFKETDPPEGYLDSNGEIFGCDICQEVCPWNQKPIEQAQTRKDQGVLKEKIEAFFLTRSRKEISSELELWSNNQYKREFKQTALERTGRVGLLKNLAPFLKNS